MKPNMIVATLLIGMLASPIAFSQGNGYRFNKENTPGWSLMSKEERVDFRRQMLASKNVDECKAVQAKHHEEMTKRAKKMNVTLNMPRANACERMKARGMFK